MPSNDGKVVSLSGGVILKARNQHPEVQEKKGARGSYWFIRYREDQIQPDRSVKAIRRRHILGPSKGDKALSKKEATQKRDEFFQARVPMARIAATKGLITFEQAARMYMESFLNRKNKVELSTLNSQTSQIEKHLIPAWGERLLGDIRPKEIEDWLYSLEQSWWSMRDLRARIRSIYNQAGRWGYWDENVKPPTSKVDIGKKEYARPRKILSEEITVKVLEQLDQPYRLICEICLFLGTRISEALGLCVEHVDLAEGTILIEQKLYKQTIGKPKTPNCRRKLALGHLAPAVAEHIGKLKKQGPTAPLFPRETNQEKPIYAERVRAFLKLAAAAEGADFPGFGLHSLRRACITWRQKHGGATAIEASKMAGHASVQMTAEYTFVDLDRQRSTEEGVQTHLNRVRKTLGIAEDVAEKQAARLTVVPRPGESKGGEAA